MALHPAVFPCPDDVSLVGSSHPLKEMERTLFRLAGSNCTVLITGETGTGKELAAEFIHRHSARKGRPFICVNCAAIPDTLLESELFGHSRGAFTGASEQHEGLLTSAAGGTVFLDEIGDMSLFAQAKILRVLEKKEVCRIGATRSVHLDIRFVAATNQNLESMVAHGTFRKDLFFRVNVAQVQVPPLRERKEDVPLLLKHYSREFAHSPLASSNSASPPLEFSEDCLRLLLRYEWPGNIRELKNLVECLSIGDAPNPVNRDHLPWHFGRGPEICAVANNPERESLISALFWAKGNKSAAAKRLQWSRMTLYRKIAKYDLLTSVGEEA